MCAEGMLARHDSQTKAVRPPTKPSKIITEWVVLTGSATKQQLPLVWTTAGSKPQQRGILAVPKCGTAPTQHLINRGHVI